MYLLKGLMMGINNSETYNADKNVQSGSIMKFPCDSIVLREGENDMNMYQILGGHAEIYTGYGTKEEVLLGVIGPQACFGEFGLLLKKPSIYTVIAYSDLVVLRISEDSFGAFVRDNQRKVTEIMRNMAKTIQVMHRQINLFVGELESGHKPDPDVLYHARRNLRSYAVYTPQFDPSDIISFDARG